MTGQAPSCGAHIQYTHVYDRLTTHMYTHVHSVQAQHMSTDSEHMHSLHVHTGVDSQHTRTQSTCMYVCLHTHRPHVCTQTRTRGRSPGRQYMSVCTRHKDVGWALPFSPVLPLQGAEQTWRVCQQLPVDEGKHKPGRVVHRQEAKGVTCREDEAPGCMLPVSVPGCPRAK